MLDPGSNRELPPIPAKRYFTIGEVSELCDVKPHVLRYWETEFPSLEPAKRRGNRRYYQRHDVLMVRQIRSLLYEQGYTIGGARLRLEGEGAKQESALSNQIVRQVTLFDRYVGQGVEPGFKSLAMGLILQDKSRTLTDRDVDAVVTEAVAAMEREHHARIRG
jgi:DNA-binding transcriptional MerR regulator